ncbi:plasmid stabilization protein [Siccirubricoccus deserti]|uniref:Plasmid stabilization protein n=1 Tax=Siccirubricoccus deserti TaxID=2013562 RepID=A0A9X0R4S2_9PROT|nr:plasmid stabilization protein [Siccirubricoccus deserti]MBC4018562.1 plasmid stabilization protein [Siccirubricoccus deserti]GGC67104.1 plasmid stabilization protein [Siccirubricoccus deserti]
MGSLTIRNLDDTLKASLRLRAARHGRSMEEEARTILRGALATEEAGAPEPNLADAVRALFVPLGGLALDLPPREPAREPPDFSG